MAAAHGLTDRDARRAEGRAEPASSSRRTLMEPRLPRRCRTSSRRGGIAQVPIVAPSATLHSAEQQSSLRVQASPGWIHQEAPSVRYCRRRRTAWSNTRRSHRSRCRAVLQLGFSATHAPSAHCPPQHSALSSQASPSETHASLEHSPPSQRRVQQSVAASHASPAGLHSPTFDSQVFVSGLHVPEQHWSSVSQSSL